MGPLAARRRLAGVGAALAAALAAGSCGEATAPLRESDLAGTYVLRTVAGRPLPYVLSNATNNFAIYGSRMTLTADGRYTGIDSAATLGDTRRAVQTYDGTWRFVRRGLDRQDVVWTRPNSLINGLPLTAEFAYKVRDRGRTLVRDMDLEKNPIDPAVYTRE